MSAPGISRASLVAALCCALNMPVALADQADFEAGIAAYNRGNHASAFALIRRSAAQGNGNAQFILSAMYRNGIGVEKDPYAGFDWCHMAAEQGVAEAQFELGLMYLDGEGVLESQHEAMKWLWAAAEQGYQQADQVLQFIFRNDFGFGC